VLFLYEVAPEGATSGGCQRSLSDSNTAGDRGLFQGQEMVRAISTSLSMDNVGHFQGRTSGGGHGSGLPFYRQHRQLFHRTGHVLNAGEADVGVTTGSADGAMAQQRLD